MTKHGSKDLARSLRDKGVRKKLAKRIGELDGNRRRAGAAGEKRAQRAADDLEDAAKEIRERVLAGDAGRRAAARKGAQTRKRNEAKRRASAKRGSNTRSKVARARAAAHK